MNIDVHPHSIVARIDANIQILVIYKWLIQSTTNVASFWLWGNSLTPKWSKLSTEPCSQLANVYSTLKILHQKTQTIIQWMEFFCWYFHVFKIDFDELKNYSLYTLIIHKWFYHKCFVRLSIFVTQKGQLVITKSCWSLLFGRTDMSFCAMWNIITEYYFS